MAGEWIGVIGTVIGVVAGGSVTYIVTRAQIKHEEKLDRSRRQLSKIEKTHELFSKVSQKTYLMNVSIIGKLTHGIAIEPEKMGDKLPLDELQMHVDIYTPEVSNKLKDISDKWLDFGRVIGEVILKPTMTDTERGDYIVKSTQITTSITRLCQEAKEQVVNTAKKYI